MAVALLMWIGPLAVEARAQWSSSFAAPGPDERVYAMIEHDDGSGPAVYVGGEFRTIDGQTVNRIARYRDGVWTDLAGGVPGPFLSRSVQALTVFNGELVAGGTFTSIGGTPANGVARWDGTAWHAFGSGLASGTVYALTVFNGQLIAAGDLDGPNGVVRWDGSAWQPIGSLEPRIFALIVYRGELIAGGDFGPNQSGNIARWTGSTWEFLGGGADASVGALAVFDGELIAGGSFTALGSMAEISAKGIARWNGVTWKSLGTGLSAFSPEYAGSGGGSLVIPDGSLVVGGWFVAAGDVEAASLAQWDGTTWSVIGGGVGDDLWDSVVGALLSVTTRDGPVLLVGGQFITAGSICANNIARFANDDWTLLSECENCQGLSGPVRAMDVHDDGAGESLYVGGACTCAGSTRVNRAGRWDGKSWSALGSGFDSEAWVLAFTEFDDGSGAGKRLYAGGILSAAGGVPVYNIAVWDGQRWSDVGGGVDDGYIIAMEVFDDGAGPALYVAGTFALAGDKPASRIAKWDGSRWSDVGGGVNTYAIFDMLVWNDGTGEGLMVAGSHGVSRWRNGAWTGLGAAGTALNGYIRSLAAWPPPNGPSLIAAGHFVDPDPSVSQYIGLAIWNGARWQGIAPVVAVGGSQYGSYAIYPYETNGCNQLYLRGLGYTPHGLQVWNGDLWSALPVQSITAPGVFSSTLPSFALANFDAFQNQIYYAGTHVALDGRPSSYIGAWDPVAALACAPDANGDETIDVSDLLAVVTQWGPCATSCAADSAPCGGDGQVNVEDLLAVISSWGPCQP